MRRTRSSRIISARRVCTGIVAGLALLSCAGSILQAQLPVTTVTSVQPPGGKRGSTFELSVGGSNLDELSSLGFSHPGITAEAKTEDAGPFRSEPRLVPNRFVVTIAKDVPVGSYELRVVGRFGTSNPRAFDVGWLDEVLEKEGNNTLADAQEIVTETTVSGTIGGADQDYFSFAAKKGQRVLVDCRAYRLDSRLDATLAIFDSRGIELERNGDDLSRDPFLDLTVPEDDKYTVSIRDVLYGG